VIGVEREGKISPKRTHFLHRLGSLFLTSYGRFGIQQVARAVFVNDLALWKDEGFCFENGMIDALLNYTLLRERTPILSIPLELDMIGQNKISELLKKEIPLPAFLNMEIPLQDIFKNRYIERLYSSLDDFVRGMDSSMKARRPRVRPARLFNLEGKISGSANGGFSIDNTRFVINPDTFVVGELRANVVARVKGLRLGSGELLATSVCIDSSDVAS